MVRRPSAVMLLLLASLSWGLATALSKVALEQITPLDLFGIEVTSGALVLGLVALGRGGRLRRPDPRVLLLGVLEPGLAYLLFDVGVAHTAATHGALLLATESIFTIALAAALLHERLDTRLRLALVAGFLGSFLVSQEGGGSAGSVAGDVLVVAASASAAGYGVLARRIAPGRDPIRLTAVQMLSASALAAPLAGIAAVQGDSRLGQADGGHLGAALAVALLASVVPFLLYNVAIERVTASVAGLILTLVPLFGTLASVVLLSETLGAGQLAGGALVGAAAALAATHAEPSPVLAGPGECNA